MNFKKVLFCLVGILIIQIANGHLGWDTPREALDQSLYEAAIDPELCKAQIGQITSNSFLRLRFVKMSTSIIVFYLYFTLVADAGTRTPRGILTGNMVDLGNYHQCLGINEEIDGSVLQGKYCMIRVPLSQSFELPGTEFPNRSDFDPSAFRLDNKTIKSLERYNTLRQGLQIMTGHFSDARSMPGSPLSGMVFRLAVCIPKSCSTEQAITSLLFNLTAIDFQYEDDFCRLPNDKPWVPGDYATVIVFSIIGFLTLLSTCYDLYQRFILKRDAKMASVIGTSFSIYTNGRRLMTFTSGPNTLDCLDGIRALAMIWVIIGHAFSSVPLWANPIEGFVWVTEPEAVWVWGAHVTVDTFFMLSGLLVVYSTAGKLNGRQLLSNLHLFYLNRLLRMFPLLAAGVLLEASYFNRMADGPNWEMIVSQAHRCRAFWWSTLLHIQNYMNPRSTCIGQSWYLAIDVQLHILCPLVLFWVLNGKKKNAWIALVTALVVFLVTSTIYNFIMEFPSGMLSPRRGNQMMYYMVYYYVNTLTRGAPFFVGMIFGYLLHLYRQRDTQLPKATVAQLWACAAGLASFVLYASYPILKLDWDNQTMDSLFNSFIRPIWATGLGCMIFASVQGYGGIINWFLSLQIWKLPARISYAMYIFHFSLMSVMNSTAITPAYFSPGSIMFTCLAHFTLTFLFSFFITLIVDSPFSTLFKLILEKGGTKPKQIVTENDLIKDNSKHA